MTLLWEKGRQVRSKLGGPSKEKEKERGSALQREWRVGTETDLQVGGDVSPQRRREKEESAGKR